ncbi:unnamed protein product [Caenorhabditis sp. 36 PRJEB53466]|nr:unnamed protein product [Caenorhabditis sp. 36 PRJEB53466]
MGLSQTKQVENNDKPTNLVRTNEVQEIDDPRTHDEEKIKKTVDKKPDRSRHNLRLQKKPARKNPIDQGVPRTAISVRAKQKVYKCPMCSKRSGCGTLMCRQCHNWVHMRCARQSMKNMPDFFYSEEFSHCIEQFDFRQRTLLLLHVFFSTQNSNCI